MNSYLHISRISCERYKPFKRRVELEFAPLTILFGNNGSGKSSLLRLVPQLLEGLNVRAQEGLPLHVHNVSFGKTFAEMVHGRKPMGFIKLGIELEGGGQRLGLDWTLRRRDVPFVECQLIESFELRRHGGPFVSLKWDEEPGSEPKYELRVQDALLDGGPFSIRFEGLLPSLRGLSNAGLKGESLKELLAVYDMLRALSSQCAYLGPVRAPIPAYELCDVEAALQHMRFDGQNAAQILYAQQHEILPTAQAFFRLKELGEHTLEIEPLAPLFGLRLKRGDISTPLGEVGLGMAQVFPLVVQRSLPQVPPSTVEGEVTVARHELVEEPESHLHPSAHGAVADLYVKGVQQDGVRSLLETHSEMFLLRLRRRIAEGGLSPENVKLYWVNDLDQSLQTVELDSEGDVDNWPDGVFSYDFEELKQLRRAQRERGGRA